MGAIIELEELLTKTCKCGKEHRLSYILKQSNALFVAMQQCSQCKQWSDYRIAIPGDIASYSSSAKKIREKFSDQ